MQIIQVVGQQMLSGSVPIDGAKNAVLLHMAASLLTTEHLKLENVPNLSDTKSMILLLEQLGVQVTKSDHFINNSINGGYLKAVDIKAEKLITARVPCHIGQRMRASVVVLGPLLARCQWVRLPMPGGCPIGNRGIDMHLKGLIAMGAQIIKHENGDIEVSAQNGLKGTDYVFLKTSVTGTANLLMAATLAKGITVLRGAAIEPEIVDLATCLQKMGAKISGVGTSTLTLQGVKSLSGTVHQTIPDRIEMGTYMLAAAVTGSCLFLEKADISLLPAFVPFLKYLGVSIKQCPDGVLVNSIHPWF